MTAPETGGHRHALLFPGQGAQFLGMGQRWYDQSPAAREVFETAEEVSGLPVRRLCFTMSRQEQARTDLTQPCVFVASLACLVGLREELARRGAPDTIVAVAGHSLGHFAALVAAGVLDLPSGLALVRGRGEIMRAAGLRRPGGMATIVGLPVATVGDLIAAADPGQVGIAAVNGPDQVVVSGTVAGLERLADRAAGAGAERVVRLAIGVAAHSPLMAEAAEEFATELAAVRLEPARVPVALNTTAELTSDPAEIRADLGRHMTSPVLWWRSVERIRAAGARLVDVGPGRTLSRMLRRAPSGNDVMATDQPSGVEALLR